MNSWIQKRSLWGNVHVSKWTFMQNLKKFPQGALKISLSREWDGWKTLKHEASGYGRRRGLKTNHFKSYLGQFSQLELQKENILRTKNTMSWTPHTLIIHTYHYSGWKATDTTALLPQENPSAKFKPLQFSINTHHKSPNEVSAWWTKFRWLTSSQRSPSAVVAGYSNELNESECDLSLTSVLK